MLVGDASRPRRDLWSQERNCSQEPARTDRHGAGARDAQGGSTHGGRHKDRRRCQASQQEESEERDRENDQAVDPEQAQAGVRADDELLRVDRPGKPRGTRRRVQVERCGDAVCRRIASRQRLDIPVVLDEAKDRGEVIVVLSIRPGVDQGETIRAGTRIPYPFESTCVRSDMVVPTAPVVPRSTNALVGQLCSVRAP